MRNENYLLKLSSLFCAFLLSFSSKNYLPDIQLNINKNNILSILSSEQEILTSNVGLFIPSDIHQQRCFYENEAHACFEWGNVTKLVITKNILKQAVCFDINWTGSVKSYKDCLNLGTAHWYGGGEIFVQRWPIENITRPISSFTTGDMLQNKIKYNGGVLERYWLNSKGVSVIVDNNVPLFVSFNVGDLNQLCFIARKSSVYRTIPQLPYLKYSICVGDNVKGVHLASSEEFFVKPLDIPDQRMFTDPIWSTWARYKKDVNETTVLQFAEEIRFNGFSDSQIEIDDFWENDYGNLEFSSFKFPDPKGMISKLKNNNFRVTLWIHPFANTNSSAFKKGKKLKYWISNKDSEPVITKWWDGNSTGLLDVTNKNATSWYINRLNKLKELGIDSFKFDAGEITWLPPAKKFIFKQQLSSPNIYSTLYAKMAAKMGRQVEVRIGSQSQHLPIFVRMLDKDSVWGYSNGLKTLIPTTLLFGILGYPFILPDMIGGNTDKPDRELFIRWIEANVFLPSMQFSISPWQYDDEVVKIAYKMVQMHIEFSPVIIKLAEESVQTGHPIIRPLWWIDPHHEKALISDDEFLLGDSILVAPILEKGARKREIFLPTGQWKDPLYHRLYKGPRILKNYKIELDEIAYFLKI